MAARSVFEQSDSAKEEPDETSQRRYRQSTQEGKQKGIDDFVDRASLSARWQHANDFQQPRG